MPSGEPSLFLTVKLTWFKRTQANCLDDRYNDKVLYKKLML